MRGKKGEWQDAAERKQNKYMKGFFFQQNKCEEESEGEVGGR